MTILLVNQLWTWSGSSQNHSIIGQNLDKSFVSCVMMLLIGCIRDAAVWLVNIHHVFRAELSENSVMPLIFRSCVSATSYWKWRLFLRKHGFDNYIEDFRSKYDMQRLFILYKMKKIMSAMHANQSAQTCHDKRPCRRSRSRSRPTYCGSPNSCSGCCSNAGPRPREVWRRVRAAGTAGLPTLLYY